MKLSTLIINLVIASSTSISLACMVGPGYAENMKNELVNSLVNKYEANAEQTLVGIDNYSHEFKWKFSDAGFQCHDTDVIKGLFTLTFPSAKGVEICDVTVQVEHTSSPEAKGSQRKTVTNVSEVSGVNCR